MGRINLWKITPLKNEIILTLINYKGQMLDTDLLRNLQTEYKDLNRTILYKALFKLEVERVIDVQKVRKGVNRIALRKNAPISKELLKELKDFFV
ncbi:MAG: hypothetical protein ACTSRZ_09160 [Promethearchaeota archaeon]